MFRLFLYIYCLITVIHTFIWIVIIASILVLIQENIKFILQGFNNSILKV